MAAKGAADLFAREQGTRKTLDHLVLAQAGFRELRRGGVRDRAVVFLDQRIRHVQVQKLIRTAKQAADPRAGLGNVEHPGHGDAVMDSRAIHRKADVGGVHDHHDHMPVARRFVVNLRTRPGATPACRDHAGAQAVTGRRDPPCRLICEDGLVVNERVEGNRI